MAIHEGNMGTALYYFQAALRVDPNNEQTKKMVAKLESKGIEPTQPESSE